MTDEQQTSDEAHQPPEIQNYSATRKTVTFNGEPEDRMEVRFGQNPTDPSLPAHVIEIRKTGMDDQFDLVEIASGQIDNDLWLSLAIVAMSVRTIDSTPQLVGNLSKAGLRKTLKVLGPTGVRAVRRALGELDAGIFEPAPKAAAGN